MYDKKMQILKNDETYQRIKEECGSQGLDEIMSEMDASELDEFDFERDSDSKNFSKKHLVEETFGNGGKSTEPLMNKKLDRDSVRTALLQEK